VAELVVKLVVVKLVVVKLVVVKLVVVKLVVAVTGSKSENNERPSRKGTAAMAHTGTTGAR
jgi:hypothetical protein